jgi:hypothetical protein
MSMHSRSVWTDTFSGVIRHRGKRSSQTVAPNLVNNSAAGQTASGRTSVARAPVDPSCSKRVQEADARPTRPLTHPSVGRVRPGIPPWIDSPFVGMFRAKRVGKLEECGGSIPVQQVTDATEDGAFALAPAAGLRRGGIDAVGQPAERQALQPDAARSAQGGKE